MKKILNKIILYIVCVCFIFMPLNLSVFAEEISIDNEVIPIEEIDNIDNEDTVDFNNQNTDVFDYPVENVTENTGEKNLENPTVDDVNDSIDEGINSDMNEVQRDETTVNVGDKSLINYFLIESPYLETPSTQNFVLSFGDGTQNIASMSLFYQKDGSEEVELSCSVQQGKLFKFTQSFNNEDSGIYRITKINYVLDEQKYEINFNDAQMDICFGVNQKYDGYDNLIDLDQSDSNTVIPELVTLDSTNINNTENEIINTINSTSGDLVSTFVNQKEPLVIALDPGHGGTESGMIAVNGVQEKVYTLKIANYLKNELEQYDNVKVVMTRTDDINMGLQDRAEKASSLGANVLISLHLNAFNKEEQGAEVYYPNENYRPDLSTEGKNLAQQIQNELVALGLQNRGIKIRHITDDSTGLPSNDSKFDYPDGTIADYYGIIRHGKNLGMAAIIVEHCFADNQTDFNNYLGSEDKIKSLAVADAKGIAKAYNLIKNVNQNFRTEIDNLAIQNKSTMKDGIYEIQSGLNQNKVLEVKSGSLSNCANIQIFNHNGTDAQRWKISHDTKGYLIIENLKSGKVLDVENAKVSLGTNVQQFEYNGSYAQKWIAVKDKEKYKLVSALNPKYVLDLDHANTTNGSNIQIFTSNDSLAQRWYFKSVRDEIDILANKHRHVLKDGRYEIQSVLNTKKVLDVKSGSVSNGANIQLFGSNSTEAQSWNISHDAKGYVIIRNVKSGKALDVQQAKNSSGTNIQQFEYNGTYAQKWIAIKIGDTYQLISALNPKLALNAQGEIAQDGSNVNISDLKDTDNQRWVFKSQYKGYVQFSDGIRYYQNDGTCFIGQGNTGKAYLKTDSTGLIKSIEITNVPFYMQNDYRWGNVWVGGHGPMSKTGCVPTCMTSIINYYKGTNYTPLDIAQFLYNNGYFNRNIPGASSDVWQFVTNYYGLNYKNYMNKQDIINSLKQGKIVTLAVDASYYGHFGYTHQIMLTGVNEYGNVRVHDPLWSSTDGWRSLDGIMSHLSRDPIDTRNGGPIFAI